MKYLSKFYESSKDDDLEQLENIFLDWIDDNRYRANGLDQFNITAGYKFAARVSLLMYGEIDVRNPRGSYTDDAEIYTVNELEKIDKRPWWTDGHLGTFLNNKTYGTSFLKLKVNTHDDINKIFHSFESLDTVPGTWTDGNKSESKKGISDLLKHLDSKHRIKEQLLDILSRVQNGFKQYGFLYHGAPTDLRANISSDYINFVLSIERLSGDEEDERHAFWDRVGLDPSQTLPLNAFRVSCQVYFLVTKK